ncbi:fumarylacetoacetate (FAA) hydrolase [Aliidongia dinghuensis]|uniref:Fumarylacetoacetate (FAA) hydrolase n=1 Tax=Aliidongia dinghuensis TaxID=1867774 RepID=A0A8J2YVU6_9PROT|nr:fumarylacetoacetate hydrolase family protein [Aliidongia dinghuensis]GGF25899.1 fumarylacetoacetate (FAA) hydrolase [Aliidongia dinghuensis]
MTDRALEAANLLISAHRSGQLIDRLPEALRPQTIEDAYAIQDHVTRALGAVTAWKVGQGGPTGPISIAPIYADRVFTSGVTLDPAKVPGAALEIEFAFRLGADLPARAQPYGYDEVMAAIEGFCPCIEVLSSRYTDRTIVPSVENLADGNANGALVYAGPLTAWRGLDFATQKVELEIDGKVCQSAVGTHPAGDPVTLVVWTANHLMTRTGGLKRGDVVTTGSLDGATPIEPGSRGVATYGAFGRAEVAFRG